LTEEEIQDIFSRTLKVRSVFNSGLWILVGYIDSVWE